MRPLQYRYGACWSIWSWVVQDLLCVQIYERMFSRHESRWAKYFNCNHGAAHGYKVLAVAGSDLEGFQEMHILNVKLMLIEKRMLVKVFWFEPALKLASSGTFPDAVSMFGLLVIKKSTDSLTTIAALSNEIQKTN